MHAQKQSVKPSRRAKMLHRLCKPLNNSNKSWRMQKLNLPTFKKNGTSSLMRYPTRLLILCPKVKAKRTMLKFAAGECRAVFIFRFLTTLISAQALAVWILKQQQKLPAHVLQFCVAVLRVYIVHLRNLCWIRISTNMATKKLTYRLL